MIKKFEEFIKESLWKSGINRAKENTVRQEEKDSFFYKDGMFPIKGFHNWFLKFVRVNKVFKRVRVYLKPDETEMASYHDVIRRGKNAPFKIRDASECVYVTTGGRITDEIREILTSDKFIDAINDTLAEMPEKYFSQMNESLWKSGINRAKTGEERIEDKINSNISSLNGIDLGFNFLIADDTLEIEDERVFTLDDIKKYKDVIAKYGWRLMTVEECQLIAYNSRFKVENGGKYNTMEFLVIESKKNKNSVSYNITATGAKKFYWVDPDENSSTKALMFSFDGIDEHIKAEPTVGRLWHNYEIILVKDK